MNKKLVWVIPVAVVLILMILATAFYPAYNPKPKDIPMAILNEDNGIEVQGNTTNIGKNLADNLKKSDNEAVNWKSVKNKEELEKGLKDNKYIGAIVFEKDFSKNSISTAQSKIMTEKQNEIKEKVKSGELSPEQIKAMQKKMGSGSQEFPEPKQAHIETIINQGSNAQVSNIAQQALSKITDQLNKQISKQNVELLAKNKMELPSNQFDNFVNPVKVETTTLNKVKDHQGNGNAASAMFTPVWFSAMITAVLSFLTFKNRDKLASHKDKLWFISKIILSVTIAAFAGAFAYVYYTGGVLNFDFNQPFDTAIFIAIAILGFASLILGVMVWIGFGAIPIFILYLFFTMQAVMLPKVMVPEFYQDYIIPWSPFYHYLNTLKDLLYNDSSLAMNSTIWMFIGFIIFGLASLISAAYVKKKTS
ncbi:YhgE/Pip domain-containing protein [Staphylococcus equorum]|uniref:YhgE/Pip domain-containing protein n=1 Tax=Staphylococcus equorum TaxID=246432 RepID=UPI001F2D0052|nr:ABC transporter permease [Staphylococcus equorum]MCE5007622.1 ABC transporter permease [Staphylococcus equorum]MEB7846605.1 ABC transporter permease [Staphylococcus equorum]